MSLKLCYNNEIHRVARVPTDFDSLLKSIQEVFSDDLPHRFTLEYQDTEGDRVIIHNDEDYALALESELSDSTKCLKIFMKDASDMDNVSFIIRESIGWAREFGEQPPEAPLSPSRARSFEILSEIKEVDAVPSLFENKSAEEPICNEDKTQVEGVAIPENEVLIETESLLVENTQVESEALPQEKVLVNDAPALEIQVTQVTAIETQDTDVSVTQQEIQSPNSGVTVLSVQKGNTKDKKLQKIARETLYQEVPRIAMMVKELLEKSQFERKTCTKKSKKCKRTGYKALHSRIACDMCGEFPIVGSRYKCLVLEDFDLCESCERKGEHPYPMIKVKDESQYSYLNAFFSQEQNLLEEQPKKSERKSKKNKKAQTQEDEFETLVEGLVKRLDGMSYEDTDYLAKLTSNLVGNLNEIPEEQELQAEEPHFEPKKEEFEPKTEDKKQTADAENPLNGLVNGFMQHFGAGASEGVNVLTSLANNFIGNWGSLFQSPEVQPAENKPQQAASMDEKEKASSTEQDPVTDKYPEEVLKKVKELFEIFPEFDFEEMCKYVSQNRNKSIEELVLDFIATF